MFTTSNYYYEPGQEDCAGWEIGSFNNSPPVELPAEVAVPAPRTQAMCILPYPIPRSPVPTHHTPTDLPPAHPAPTHFTPTHSEEPHPARTFPTPLHFTPADTGLTHSMSICAHSMPTHLATTHCSPNSSRSTQPERLQYRQRRSSLINSPSTNSISMHFAPDPESVPTPSMPRYPTQWCTRATGSTSHSSPDQAIGQYPKGDFRNSSLETVRDLQSTIMVNWLRQIQMEKIWSGRSPGEGVVLKKDRDSFVCCPESLKSDLSGFYSQVVAMNVRCAITVNTPVIVLFLSRHSADYVPLTDDLRIQVIPSLAFLSGCKKHHFGAFIKDQKRLIVWDDDPRSVLGRVENIVNSLVQLVWEQTESNRYKSGANRCIMDTERRIITAEELEEGETVDKRPTLLINPVMVGLTITLLITALGFGWRNLAQQVSIDQNYIRLAILAVTPCQIFVSLFFMQTIVVNIGQILGPVNQLKINSKFYSGKPPPRLDRNLKALPHVTIQMPVYKEGLQTVIRPTIRSLRAALSTYELQGGTGNIFVNDDGMQLLSENEAQTRREFYDENNIGWVARPKHNPKPQDCEKAFIRGGKFKKASNMNFALMISIKVEEALLKIERDQNWNQEKESAAYQQCLARVLEEDHRAWAAGDIRVGDYILLIDSDTRVPPDCLLDAASEMELSPQVAILQYSSGVMTVTDNFFEKGVTFFTNLIYTAIRYTVANGDVAPFVGHNAVLRWSALQQVSYNKDGGPDKFWSESHVSEDFDMSLRLQIAGFTIRLGSYPGDGFKEGVSLTVYDELSRWEKYAYGCNELLFHPLRFWITRGPFTPLFRKFICSNIRVTSKITIMAYIGTYYAIAASWLLTLTNYFLIGWFNGYLDHYYIDSFKVYFSLIVVFSAMGNFALAILRYRLSEKSLFGAIYENFQWLLLLTIFLGGSSLHVSQAILCHFFEINMSWGATAKEAENFSFFQEVPRLLSRFKYTFLFCLTCAGMIIAGVLYVPWPWKINDFVAIFPLATLIASHFLLPIVLNPALMQFTW